jgi:hypothetical protein
MTEMLSNLLNAGVTDIVKYGDTYAIFINDNCTVGGTYDEMVAIENGVIKTYNPNGNSKINNNAIRYDGEVLYTILGYEYDVEDIYNEFLYIKKKKDANKNKKPKPKTIKPKIWD